MRRKFSQFTVKKIKEYWDKHPERAEYYKWQKSSMYATRSAAEFWGWNWPDNIACMRAGKYITYEQLKREKIEKQKRQLELKRRSDNPRKVAVFVWTFYNDTTFFGGWWTCVYNNKGLSETVDFRGTEYLIDVVMQAFPLGSLPFREFYYDWIQDFSAAYPARGNPPKAERRDGRRKAWAWVEGYNTIVKLEPAE